MPVTASEALAYVHSMNQRNRKPIPAFLQDSFPAVYIYNIYNRPHMQRLGSLGTFYIPACQPGKPYSEPCIVKGFIADEYDTGDGQGNMSWNAERGQDVAKDVIGIGSSEPGLSLMTTNLEWWGCFIAQGEKPTQEELDEARRKLDKMMALFLADGDRLAPFQNDPKTERLSGTHFAAAAYLKQPRNWSTSIAAMQDCPGCGSVVKPHIAKCPNCGAILDKLKAIELGLIPDETAPVAAKAK